MYYFTNINAHTITTATTTTTIIIITITTTTTTDRRASKAVIDTTVSICNCVGVGDVVSVIVNHLKDDSEAFRKMVCECIDKIVTNLGTAGVDERLEER